MVATRAQRAQTKDEPTASKRGALKEPARRGKKKVELEEPAPAAKSTRTSAARRAATTKPAAPATRRTHAKEPETPAPEEPEHTDDEQAEEEPVAPAPARATRKTATKGPPKPSASSATTTTASRKRSAREVEPETARPAKRQTRSRAPAESEQPAQDEAMEEQPKAAPVAKRATRATRGTKASETRSAATVKPLAQRITVTAKKQARKTKEEKAEPVVPDVEMEDAEEAPAPALAKSTRKSSRKAASEEPEDSAAAEADAPVEPTPAKSAKKSSRKKALEEVPEIPADEVETKKDKAVPETPIKTSSEKVEASPKEDKKSHETAEVPEVEESASGEQPAVTPVKTPEVPQQPPKTPAKQTPAPPKPARVEMKENVPPAKTPGPAHYTSALPFAQEATPFFRPDKTVSLQARTPGLNKSLLQETPRKASVGVSPFKLPPMSAAKPRIAEATTGSMLNSPAKRAPFAASMHGMTLMKPSDAKPEVRGSILQTPARKGLMLPPSTAPVNKQGFQSVQAKSSLLQTCPRRIALPSLAPKSSAASPTKSSENIGSSLLSATPRKVRIEPPAKPAFGSSVQDFAFQPRSSVLGAEPRRWNTPAKTPAKRFATPGRSPEKSLVDADAGSPTPVKKTPAGLKDVNSALKLLHERSPALPPATPTEQFVLNVIDKLDQSMSESESSQEEALGPQSQDIEVARSEPEGNGVQHDITADLALPQEQAEEMEQCVSPADLVMSDNETPAESPAAELLEDVLIDEQTEAPTEESAAEEKTETEQVPAKDMVQDVSQMETVTEELIAVEHHEEYVEATPARSEIQFIEESHEHVDEKQEMEYNHQPMLESNPIHAAPETAVKAEEHTDAEDVQEMEVEYATTVVEEFVQEPAEEKQVSILDIQATAITAVPERPSTPTMEEQHIAALAKEKAKTERRARHKRLSLAIELENSIKKPRKSLAFIPSLTPAKSALRSPFKRPFGSPKKSVAWATEPVEPRIIEETQQPEKSKVETPLDPRLEVEADVEVNIPHPNEALLSDTVFFVDVRAADGEDAGDLFIPLLEEMGAKIVNTWSGIEPEITHVLFKDGAIETLEKVASTHGAVKAVNICWVLDCERFNKWVPEADYLIDIPRLLGTSSARALTTLSTANTPVRATPAKSAFGTPFAVMGLTPKTKPSTLSPFANVTPRPSNDDDNASPENKENTPPAQLFMTPTKASPALTAAGEFSPSTPYFLHAQNIVQKTCPPKQQMKGLFEREERSEVLAVTPFRQKMLLARRSLSPGVFAAATAMGIERGL